MYYMRNIIPSHSSLYSCSYFLKSIKTRKNIHKQILKSTYNQQGLCQFLTSVSESEPEPASCSSAASAAEGVVFSISVSWGIFVMAVFFYENLQGEKLHHYTKHCIYYQKFTNTNNQQKAHKTLQ